MRFPYSSIPLIDSLCMIFIHNHANLIYSSFGICFFFHVKIQMHSNNSFLKKGRLQNIFLELQLPINLPTYSTKRIKLHSIHTNTIFTIFVYTQHTLRSIQQNFFVVKINAGRQKKTAQHNWRLWCECFDATFTTSGNENMSSNFSHQIKSQYMFSVKNPTYTVIWSIQLHSAGGNRLEPKKFLACAWKRTKWCWAEKRSSWKMRRKITIRFQWQRKSVPHELECDWNVWVFPLWFIFIHSKREISFSQYSVSGNRFKFEILYGIISDLDVTKQFFIALIVMKICA